MSRLSPYAGTEELPRIMSQTSGLSTGGISNSSSVLPDALDMRGPPAMDGNDDDDQGSVYTFGDDGATGVQPPHEDSYHIVANSAKAQIDATEQLLESFGVSPAGTGPPSMVDGQSGHRSRPSLGGPPEAQIEVKRALQQSIRRLGDLIDEHLEQAADRERWYARRYEREMDAKRLWEETTRQVAQEQAELENELNRVSQASSRRKRELRGLRQSVALDQMDAHADDVTQAALAAGPPGSRLGGSPSPSRSPARSPPLTPTGNLSAASANRARAFSTATARAPSMMATVTGVSQGGSSEEDSDGEEEFFEAIDQANLPLTVDKVIAQPEAQPVPEAIKETHDRAEYEPYKKLRTELPIKADNRPPVSLWAILKGSIGKDLTKISFPVYFVRAHAVTSQPANLAQNEPTSMLQRMAEDMEFSECRAWSPQAYAGIGIRKHAQWTLPQSIAIRSSGSPMSPPLPCPTTRLPKVALPSPLMPC
jgi:hypothetical protein